jgi:small-conductance mechanosensitive channel
MPSRRTLIAHFVATAILSGSTLAWAQDSAQEPASEVPTAPVVLDGVILARVRGVFVYPAERRAREVADRIKAFASDRSVPVDSLKVREMAEWSDIVAGDRRIMGVRDVDAQLEGLSRQVLAEVYRRRIAEAVEGYRHDRQADVLVPHAMAAIAATLAFILGLWIGRWLLKWLRDTVKRRYGTRVRDVAVGSFQFVRADQVWGLLDRALGFIAIAIALAAGYTYLHYVLVLFPWTRGLGNSLFAILIGPLRTLAAGALELIPNLVFLAILFLATRYLLRLIRLFFTGVADRTVTLSGFDPDLALPTFQLVRIGVIVFALVVAYPYIPGSGSEAFKGISLLLGVVFSLGSPSVIGNIIAGQSLAYRRAFKVGDRIKVGAHLGDVERIRLLVTHLRTPKNEEVVIPNSVILSTEVVNYSALAREGGLILHSIVGIGYETPWRQVEAMLLEAAARTPGLLREPKPFVLHKVLGTFSVDYEINVYCNTPNLMLPLYTALHQQILDVFNEYGVQIMTPAYMGDPEQAKVVPRSEWFAAPARPPLAEPESTPGEAEPSAR